MDQFNRPQIILETNSFDNARTIFNFEKYGLVNAEVFIHPKSCENFKNQVIWVDEYLFAGGKLEKDVYIYTQSNVLFESVQKIAEATGHACQVRYFLDGEEVRADETEICYDALGKTAFDYLDFRAEEIRKNK